MLAVKDHMVKKITLNEWWVRHFTLDLSPVFFFVFFGLGFFAMLIHWCVSVSRCVLQRNPPPASHTFISFNVIRAEAHWLTLVFKVPPSVVVGWRKCYFNMKGAKGRRDELNLLKGEVQPFQLRRRSLCNRSSLCLAFVWASEKKKRANKGICAALPHVYAQN